jgi:hypothetical protein
MSWLTWLLLESLPALAVPLGLALFVLLVHWRRGGRPLPLLIGLGAAVLLLVVQTVVVTKREHASRILGEIERDLVASRVDALVRHLSPNFPWDHPSETFPAYVRGRMHDWDLRWADRRKLEISHDGANRFVATASYLAEVMADDYAAVFRSRWSVTFERTDDGWKIIDVTPEHIDGMNNPDWSEIRRGAR